MKNFPPELVIKIFEIVDKRTLFEIIRATNDKLLVKCAKQVALYHLKIVPNSESNEQDEASLDQIGKHPICLTINNLTRGQDTNFQKNEFEHYRKLEIKSGNYSKKEIHTISAFSSSMTKLVYLKVACPLIGKLETKNLKTLEVDLSWFDDISKSFELPNLQNLNISGAKAPNYFQPVKYQLPNLQTFCSENSMRRFNGEDWNSPKLETVLIYREEDFEIENLTISNFPLLQSFSITPLVIEDEIMKLIKPKDEIISRIAPKIKVKDKIDVDLTEILVCGTLSSPYWAEMKFMRSLTLKHYGFKSVPVLNDFMYLERLDLGWNEISKIENVNCHKKLKYFALDHNQITKMEQLDGLENLEELNLAENNITKVENLESLKSLKSLNLKKNEIDEIISDFKQQANLISLDLEDNKISNLKNFQNLVSLKSLNMKSNGLTSLRFGSFQLKHLENLEFIDFFLNKITSLEPINKMKNLKYIEIGKNKLPQIGDLLWPKIVKFNLHFNEVTDFESLKRLKNLQELDLAETPVMGVSSMLGVIDALQNLTTLRLGLRGLFKAKYGTAKCDYFNNPELIMPLIERDRHLVSALKARRPSLYIQTLMLG
ncbi:hypothetical protein DASC09_040670 [Saccharomycopsis crataegensis]|uniref:F-box domain-containing protein n=1 Tax=Saccharomycopsis crataegensis TaxID=43959 RepID=A0AAV5QQH9_9ASCO|nr:hypothetical protein DASC09_040670 [Saccharomycopsis crataegensis]